MHDFVVVVVTRLLAVLIRFGSNPSLAGHDVSYFGVVFAIGGPWILSLGLGRCYEMRFLAEGSEEYRRVGNSSLRLIGLLGFIAFATKSDIARGFALIYFPLGLVGLIASRWWLRVRLSKARMEGREFHRVVVAGRYAAIRDLIHQLESDTRHGFRVVGACVSGGPDMPGETPGVPMLGALTGIRTAVESSGADTVAAPEAPVAPCPRSPAKAGRPGRPALCCGCRPLRPTGPRRRGAAEPQQVTDHQRACAARGRSSASAPGPGLL